MNFFNWQRIQWPNLKEKIVVGGGGEGVGLTVGVSNFFDRESKFEKKIMGEGGLGRGVVNCFDKLTKNPNLLFFGGGGWRGRGVE